MKQITLEKCQRKVENKHDKFLEWKTDKEMIKRLYELVLYGERLTDYL